MNILLELRREEMLGLVTEKVMKVAARCGNGRGLDLLAEHMAVSEQWFEICDFYLAAASGNVEEVQRLFGKVSNPNLKDGLGRTPLHRATRRRHTEVIMFLVAMPSVDVNTQDLKGMTPLHDAVFLVRKPEREETAIYLLLRAGADPHIANVAGDTPISMAQEYGRPWQLYETSFKRRGEAVEGSAQPSRRDI